MNSKTNLFTGLKIWGTIILLSVATFGAFSQTTIPFQIVNNSTDFTDDQVYVGLIGKTTVDGDVWIDFAANDVNTPAIKKFNAADNTIHITPEDWGYAPILTKLSDIKNKTVHIPAIFGCRMYLSFRKPLYFHFHATGGNTQPDLANSSDPNKGIRFETIEITWAPNGMWVNTTRVDAYQYAMGLEIWGKPGANNAYLKTGELISHSAILARWQATFPTGDFTPCYTTDIFAGDPAGGIIEQPSKIASFKAGGASENYYKTYIDQIWNYFTTNEMVAKIPNNGEYRGKVINGAFQVVDKAGVAAWISAKPTTQEIIEAKGVIAEDVAATPNIGSDKSFQAQFCGAIGRGAVSITTPSGVVQDWTDVTKYFAGNTYNKYVWFWHQSDVSYDGKSYGFAYDDTNDQSSTLVTSIPDKVKITIGGFYVPNYVPVLASITVSPNASTIGIGVSQLFTASGKDQMGNAMSVAPVWSATGGTINPSTGSFSSATAGKYTITATSGAIQNSTQVTVSANGGGTSCLLTTPSGDFTVSVSSNKSNPTFTFIPSAKASGTPTCNFFYKVSATMPNWGLVGANNVVPNTPFTITAAEGEKVYYYYTYSLTAGGEQNSIGSNDNFVVGSCAPVDLGEVRETVAASAFPNPVTNVLNITFPGETFSRLSIIDLSGKSVYGSQINGDETEMQINFESFAKGYYTLVLNGNLKTEVLKIFKK